MAATGPVPTSSGHLPVLRDEVVEALAVRGPMVVFDCTFGRGGHARAMLARLGDAGRLIGLDRDPEAVAAGLELAGEDARFAMVAAPFSKVAGVADEHGVVGHVDAMLFDLGVSSPQVDTPGRGFSFRDDGPLDMRMNPHEGVSAAEWLASAGEGEIADTIYQFGEERESRRIARAIVRRRSEQAFETTRDLAETIARCIRRREPGRHPATRSFQAIRIRINAELDEIATALKAVPALLAPGGRLAVISFHSLEDRLVKRFMRDAHRGPELPRGLPPPPDAPVPPFASVSRAIRASKAEVDVNPRARSAVLRVAEMRA